jgi:hypothetical protein
MYKAFSKSSPAVCWEDRSLEIKRRLKAETRKVNEILFVLFMVFLRLIVSALI